MIQQSHSWAYIQTKTLIQKDTWDFPGSTVDMNPSANTGDRVGSLVWEDSGVPQLLSQHSRAHVPQLLKSASPRTHESQLISLCAATTATCVPRAPAPQREKPLQWVARKPKEE